MDAIKDIKNFPTFDHKKALTTSTNLYCNALKDHDKEVLGSVLENMDRLTVRVVRRSIRLLGG